MRKLKAIPRHLLVLKFIRNTDELIPQSMEPLQTYGHLGRLALVRNDITVIVGKKLQKQFGT